MAEPLVSVAMSALNAAASIGLAVRSILEQTYANWEMIVIDDGSTDATPQIVGAFADARIRLVRDGRNLGLATRLNQAIALARGTYVARMDADDVAYPTRLERQIAFLETHPDIDLIGSSAMVFAGNGSPIGVFPVEPDHTRICAHPQRGFLLPHPTWVARREWYARFGYRESARRAQDQDLLLRAHRTSRFANLPDILLGYRQETPTAGSILRGRWHYGQALWKYAAERGDYGLALRGAATQTLRTMVTVTLVALGRGNALLRRRFGPPTSAQIESWRALWAHLTGASPAQV